MGEQRCNLPYGPHDRIQCKTRVQIKQTDKANIAAYAFKVNNNEMVKKKNVQNYNKDKNKKKK
jgi:hypothetical protein